MSIKFVRKSSPNTGIRRWYVRPKLVVELSHCTEHLSRSRGGFEATKLIRWCDRTPAV